MPLGFLAVFCEPGSQVTIEEFQDWYNNEHVPLRLNFLPSFLTGARFSECDGQKPSWLAVYDVDDTKTFYDESYTRLRANRSVREANLVQRLEIFDRRTCEVVYDSGESKATNSLKYDNPTTELFTHGLNVLDVNLPDQAADKVVRAFMQDLVPKLRKVDGWVRSRALRCIDDLTGGTSLVAVPKYLILHEQLSADVSLSPICRSSASETNSQVVFSEERRWILYRAYPCVAQGNVHE